jgi:tRNA dimethylallyltransferase
MIEAGALAEVRALRERNLPPGVPAMKAIGVRQFASVLRGELALEQAVEEAKAATRQYAKRQSTWFRNQMGGDWQRLAGTQASFS